MQCCLEPQGQHCINTRDTLDTLVICSCTMLSDSTSSKHCTGKNPVKCCLNTARATFTVKNLEAPDNNAQEKTCSMLS